jgi:hypothetical protein
LISLPLKFYFALIISCPFLFFFFFLESDTTTPSSTRLIDGDDKQEEEEGEHWALVMSLCMCYSRPSLVVSHRNITGNAPHDLTHAIRLLLLSAPLHGGPPSSGAEHTDDDDDEDDDTTSTRVRRGCDERVYQERLTG